MSSERAQLFIGTAIEEGWTAFRRAPWSFVGFVLLTGVLSQLLAVLPLPGVGSLLSALVNLWGAVGLIADRGLRSTVRHPGSRTLFS